MRHRFFSRWLWRIAFIVSALALLSIFQVLAFAFIDPPSSAFIQRERLENWISGEFSRPVNYQWADYSKISRYLPLALIAAEDQRFLQHNGFDFAAIEKALQHNAKTSKVRGGSTISQQLAKNLFLWSQRSWLRKGLEGWYTTWIELLWSKQRIIEVYANLAEFGEGVYGAEAAAQKFFARSASALTPAQAARLAAVLPSPKRYNAGNPGPHVQRRVNWIQRQMRQLGGVTYLEKL